VTDLTRLDGPGAAAVREQLVAVPGTERAWLITHDLDTPARALYRSLGFQQLGRGPSAGTTPTGSSLAPSSHPLVAP
jgi:hypothetical protein